MDSLIKSIVGYIKLAIFTIAIWFIVAGGAMGWYWWIREKVLGTRPSDRVIEAFGNKVFLIWIISLLSIPLAMYFIEDFNILNNVIVSIIYINFIFGSICLIGLLIFLTKL